MKALIGAVPLLLSVLHHPVAPVCQQPVPLPPSTGRSAETAQPADPLKAAISRLGAFDYGERTSAARTIRRAPAERAVPALMDAATHHADGYVRFRALVLLTGFPDPKLAGLMRQALSDPNDRLRQAAYRYFEHAPDPALVPTLLGALDREHAEFVRPALVRALAATAGNDPRVQQALIREVGRGATVFRSATIEALGDYRARYAEGALVDATRLDGSLEEDAALALGKLGDASALRVLAGLQQTAPPESQPEVAAAICLLGVNCSSHLGYLERVLRFAGKTPGYQALARGAATGLGAVAAAGNRDALLLLVDIGSTAREPLRGPLALAVGTVALRNTGFLLEALQEWPDSSAAVALVAEAFDMLEEDFEKERFFLAVRAAYWQLPEAARGRSVARALLDKLDF